MTEILLSIAFGVVVVSCWVALRRMRRWHAERMHDFQN
jgi:uncharacterized membrane-anchored protein